MASKRQKHTASSTSGSRSPAGPLSEMPKLKKQIAELRKRVTVVEKERDIYRRAAQAYLNSTITPEEMASWYEGEFIEGSLVDLFKKAEKEYNAKHAKGKKAS